MSTVRHDVTILTRLTMINITIIMIIVAISIIKTMIIMIIMMISFLIMIDPNVAAATAAWSLRCTVTLKTRSLHVSQISYCDACTQ
jgi:uncharacterized membrane protein